MSKFDDQKFSFDIRNVHLEERSFQFSLFESNEESRT